MIRSRLFVVIIAVLLSVIPAAAPCFALAYAPGTLDGCLEALSESVPEPVFSPIGGEWAVVCLARSGYFDADSRYFADYYSRIEQTVRETASPDGSLHRSRTTDNSRLVLALSAIGRNPKNVAGYDITAPLKDAQKLEKQGINGVIYALIALGASGGDKTLCERYANRIIELQLPDGGWALMGERSDPDITGMALQALRVCPDISAESAGRALSCLSAMQRDNGGFATVGVDTAESIAQVITGCCAWNVDPATDTRFVKNGVSAVDALMGFYSENDRAFRHLSGGGANGMATEQAIYSLVAYKRLTEGKPFLYDMSDVVVNNDTETEQTTLAPVEQTTSAPVGASETDTTATDTTAAGTTAQTLSIPKTGESAALAFAALVCFVCAGLFIVMKGGKNE